ncbi:hypothetical protein D3C75_1378400 [compost metagenome]
MADIPAAAASQHRNLADFTPGVTYKPQRRHAERLLHPLCQLAQGAAIREFAHPA